MLTLSVFPQVWKSYSGSEVDIEQKLEAVDRGSESLTYCYITEASQVDVTLHAKGGNNCLLVSVGFPDRLFPDAPKPITSILVPSEDLVLHSHWRFPSYNTGSAQSWYFAKFWYRTCRKHHKTCNRKNPEGSGESQWYPTRLIKISRWTNNLRLVITETERPQSSYVTLSHCWGKADFIQLTQDTLDQFQKDIIFSDLPKTFQQAVGVARDLGLYYIWIDSLCIIQREETLEDWIREAPKMDQVYSNAVLNISATGARDSSQGLFFPRTADSMKLPEIRLDWSFKTKGSIRFTIMDYNYWKELVTDEPLIKRAWVVQERLLAPRVLHFGSVQLFWECHEGDASEDWPMSPPPVL